MSPLPFPAAGRTSSGRTDGLISPLSVQSSLSEPELPARSTKEGLAVQPYVFQVNEEM